MTTFHVVCFSYALPDEDHYWIWEVLYHPSLWIPLYQILFFFFWVHLGKIIPPFHSEDSNFNGDSCTADDIFLDDGVPSSELGITISGMGDCVKSTTCPMSCFWIPDSRNVRFNHRINFKSEIRWNKNNEKYTNLICFSLTVTQ